MSKYCKKSYKIAIVIILFFSYLQIALAQGPTMKDTLEQTGNNAGYITNTVNEFSLSLLLGSLVNIFLSLLGVIFVILIIYAGYNWMTASGDEAKVEKARDTLWRAIIGLIITIGAFAIWRYVFFKLVVQI